MALHFKILIGLFLGIIWAVIGSWLGISEFTINWIDPFGEIFINLLKLIAVPLVLFSIIKGISSLQDIGIIGKMGLKTLGFYLLSTVFAIGIGLLLANTIKPGKKLDESQRLANHQQYLKFKNGGNEVDTLSGNFSEKIKLAGETKKSKPLQFLVDMVPSNIFISLNNNALMLQVIFFAIFFGVCLNLIPNETSQPLIKVIDAFNDVFIKMVDVVMQAAPFFVFALMAGKLTQMAGDSPSRMIDIFMGLGWYSLTVILGLAIMIFIFYPGIISIFTKNRISYRQFFRAIGPAQALAFSTSSSAATLPVTMECVQDNLKVSKSTVSFVLPIGATVNMDGTSLYQAVAVLFLAQMHMIDLSLEQQIIIVLTTTLASIGSAAVPSAGLVMLIIVLESVGLDPEWVAIIFPVDRILDMCRTVVNVTGDATVATIVDKSE
jgi:Na+/H+-dicarboxylate symporter